MSTLSTRRVAALFLGIAFAVAALPSPGRAQEARIRIAGLVSDPIPIAALAPVTAGHPSTAVSAPAAGNPSPPREVTFTAAPGPYSARLVQAVAQGSVFRTAMIELLRNGQVFETITLTDVRVTSVDRPAPGRGARDHVTLSFGALEQGAAARGGGRSRQPPVP